jgi:hypothetical protein
VPVGRRAILIACRNSTSENPLMFIFGQYSLLQEYIIPYRYKQMRLFFSEKMFNNHPAESFPSGLAKTAFPAYK